MIPVYLAEMKSFKEPDDSIYHACTVESVMSKQIFSECLQSLEIQFPVPQGEQEPMSAILLNW